MFEKGDIVGMPLRVLLDDYQEERLEERTHHPFNHREMIYGCVSVANNRGQFFIRWNVEGIFKIDEDTARDMNSVIFDEDDLILIRCKDDPEVDQDPQIGLFFSHNGDRWVLTEPENLCAPIDCTSNCSMLNRRYKYPMKQLFLDLSMPINGHMSNRQKRFVCYRFYTKMRHGILRAGDRRALYPCVENEVELWFPPPFGEERVGFRDIRG